MDTAENAGSPTFEQGFRTISPDGEPVAVFMIWTPTCFDSIVFQFFGGPFEGEQRVIELDACHKAASELGSLLTQGGVTVATAASGHTFEVLITSDQKKELSLILPRPKVEHFLRRIINAITMGHSA